ncbi:MAG: hypothetical protein JNK48_29715 [Bryobacterales bacterium]|nr:hypothetical protein [Bryobacterales bacterium]
MAFYMKVDGVPGSMKGKTRYAGWIELVQCRLEDKNAKAIIATLRDDQAAYAAVFRWAQEAVPRKVAIHGVEDGLALICIDIEGAIPSCEYKLNTRTGTRELTMRLDTMSIVYRAPGLNQTLDCHTAAPRKQ